MWRQFELRFMEYCLLFDWEWTCHWIEKWHCQFSMQHSEFTILPIPLQYQIIHFQFHSPIIGSYWENVFFIFSNVSKWSEFYHFKKRLSLNHDMPVYKILSKNFKKKKEHKRQADRRTNKLAGAIQGGPFFHRCVATSGVACRNCSVINHR